VQAADGYLVKAQAAGANPRDRGKCGGKRLLLTDGTSMSLTTGLSNPTASYTVFIVVKSGSGFRTCARSLVRRR
jgi:hypothetical protein